LLNALRPSVALLDPTPMVLVQIPSGLGIMEGMQRFVPVEELFKGRHFDRKSWC
jgi:hypothetical protein